MKKMIKKLNDLLSSELSNKIELISPIPQSNAPKRKISGVLMMEKEDENEYNDANEKDEDNFSFSESENENEEQSSNKFNENDNNINTVIHIFIKSNGYNLIFF